MLATEARRAAAAGLLHGCVAAAGTAESLDLLWAWGDAAVSPARRPMTTDAVFDVASLTKAVATATACGICIDRGRLLPDAPATGYFPRLARFPGDPEPLRVRDLATHCSGYDNVPFASYAPGRIEVEATESPAQWPVRQRYVYCCRNFIVLGLIVERLTGEDLGSFCEREVFVPLGMARTRFGPLPGEAGLIVPSSQPAGIIEDGQARDAGRPVGNAGIFSTAADLAAFCRMLLRGGRVGAGRLLGDEALRWLLHPCGPDFLPRRSFGWDMRTVSECLHRPRGLSDAAVGHSGWTGQAVWIDPEQGLYTIVLTNRTHAPAVADNYDGSQRFRARLAEVLIAAVRAGG